jgi:uncharacterized protein (TIGR03067 family)
MLRTLPVLFLCAPPVLAADPPADLKPFQGKWVVKAATLAGRDHLDDFKTMTLTITDDKYTATVNALKDAGTIIVDAKKSPKWLTLASAEKKGPFLGRTMPGIYEFKDGELTVCINSGKDEGADAKLDRPVKFDAPEKTPVMLITFEREKKK